MLRSLPVWALWFELYHSGPKCVSSRSDCLNKGTKWTVFGGKKDSFYAILKRKYSFRRDSNPRSINYEANSLPLSYLTCWWMGIEVAYKSQNCLFTNQSSIRNCHKSCEQFLTKCCCCAKIAATLTLASTDIFLIKMWQESYNRRESWVFF